MMLTQKRLKELLQYNPDTGEFRWIAKRSGARHDRPAGYIHGAYAKVEVEGRQYRAHRLAWLYMTGKWPAQEIDHIDRNGLNNRWRNLRDVSKSANKRNGNRYRGRKLPKGVYAQSGRYYAAVRRDGSYRYLGSFDTVTDASKAVEMVA